MSVCQLLLLLLALAINPSRVSGAVSGKAVVATSRAASQTGPAPAAVSNDRDGNDPKCPQGWVELSSCSKDVKADDYVCVKMGPPIKVGEASEREKKRERERERKRMIDR